MKAPILIVDSSVIVKWLVTQDELHIDESDRLLKNFQNGSVRLFAPEIAKYEVGNALINKKINPNIIKKALREFYNIPLVFVSETEDLAAESLELAIEYKVTYYDASFIALAARFKASLVTDNIKHQGKYNGKEVKVIPLKNYQ